MHFKDKLKLREILRPWCICLIFIIREQAKSPLSNIITKVNKLDSSLSRQEDVVAFDVTMDDPVVVQMLEPLLS